MVLVWLVILTRVVVSVRLMNIEQIKQRIANGFKPFTLRLSDGRKLAVAHPEYVAVGRRVVVVRVFIKKTQRTPERELRIARQRAKEVR